MALMLTSLVHPQLKQGIMSKNLLDNGTNILTSKTKFPIT